MAIDNVVRRLAAGRAPWALIATGVAAGLLIGSARGKQRAVVRTLPGMASGEPNAHPGDAPPDRAFGEARSTDEPRVLQHARAAQRGRGRKATSPWEIPWTGWQDILWRTYEQINADRLLSVAAGVVFFSLLAIFPAVTALVSSYGLFADITTIGDHLATLAGLMPAGGYDIVRDQIARIVSKGGGELGFAFVVGFGLALWSANAGMKAIFDALNVIYDEDEKRSFIGLNLLSLAFTLCALAAILLAVAAVVVFPLVLTFFGIQAVNPLLISLLRWPILFALIILALSVLYRFGPSRRSAEWRWVSVGSLFAALAWIAGSLAFSYYLANFADYNATYGSLGAVIGLMMWMWMSAIVVLVGAELNAEIEHQTAHDSTVGRIKPLGRRGAAMADTVGEAKV